MKIFPLRGVRGHTPSLNLGHIRISEATRTTRVKILHTFRCGQLLFSSMKNFPLSGVRGRSAPSVNSGPPHISESATARKLNSTHI